jgi:hypothetical protein
MACEVAMETRGLRRDRVVLAGAREIRTVESTAAAERELAGGFQPVAVLLGSDLCGPAAADFARRMCADPARAAIPVLAVSGDDDRMRITLVNEELDPPCRPEELDSLLQVLEEICAEPMRLAG